MARRKKRQPLVPEARQELDQLQVKLINQALGTQAKNPEEMKMEMAKQLGILYNQQGNEDMKAKDAGKIGGAIGGQLVKKLVQMSLDALSRR
ncbi:small, acid-soluble spore protein, alpha/beta type [Thermoflavimicrobium dichotomicum]|uniref:Small, acid-soluble spore protein, alpha/beta type n=1 Tax=Thermoflavimicrobium dichotomicum TaxID=46223 RepID=A0A1I3MFJ8_9BACL|nr:small, acid-soluble spore protein, alpha/beta type [Thermoflavimicrobium dichotomicum]SFI95757.1 Small, acid-soluble spore protein, alpha/beta type [Thermoflavimicrobium dichotomicum]